MLHVSVRDARPDPQHRAEAVPVGSPTQHPNAAIPVEPQRHPGVSGDADLGES